MRLRPAVLGLRERRIDVSAVVWVEPDRDRTQHAQSPRRTAVGGRVDLARRVDDEEVGGIVRVDGDVDERLNRRRRRRRWFGGAGARRVDERDHEHDADEQIQGAGITTRSFGQARHLATVVVRAERTPRSRPGPERLSAGFRPRLTPLPEHQPKPSVPQAAGPSPERASASSTAAAGSTTPQP